MTEPFVSRGFRGRRQPGATGRRLTPGQYETRGFPVLSAGPTPRTSLATWDFTGRGPSAPVARWTWDEFEALPHETVTTDIHCVTKWSELDTVWGGLRGHAAGGSLHARGGVGTIRARGVRRWLHGAAPTSRSSRSRGAAPEGAQGRRARATVARRDGREARRHGDLNGTFSRVTREAQWQVRNPDALRIRCVPPPGPNVPKRRGSALRRLAQSQQTRASPAPRRSPKLPQKMSPRAAGHAARSRVTR